MLRLTREHSPFGESLDVHLVYNLTRLDSIALVHTINIFLLLEYKR